MEVNDLQLAGSFNAKRGPFVAVGDSVGASQEMLKEKHDSDWKREMILTFKASAAGTVTVSTPK